MKSNKCKKCAQPTNTSFCSRSCASSFNNKIRQLKPRLSKIYTCKGCLKEHNRRSKYCKVCSDQYVWQKKTQKIDSVPWRTRIKIKAVEYKGGSCMNCGYNKCIQALQFHHLDPIHKDFNISGTIKAWLTIKSELDKCILLCANCHTEKHYLK